MKDRPFPPEYAHYLYWDVTTPVRPWEWWEIDAEAWHEARAVQAAYRQGVDDANAEEKG